MRICSQTHAIVHVSLKSKRDQGLLLQKILAYKTTTTNKRSKQHYTMVCRLQLIQNSAATNPSAETVVVARNLTHLQTLARGKLARNHKNVRLYVRANCWQLPKGTELISESQFDLLNQDAMIAVATKGQEYRGPGRVATRNQNHPTNQESLKYEKGADASTKKGLLQMTPPPGYPSLGLITAALEENSTIEQRTAATTSEQASRRCKIRAPRFPASLPSETMQGRFPVLNGNLVPALLELSQQYPLMQLSEQTFAINDSGDVATYWVADYRGAIDYPPLEPENVNRKSSAQNLSIWQSALLRECRGLIVSPITGQVVARRFHKFFNLHQTPETSLDRVGPLPSGSVYSTKVDGSLVSPIPLWKLNEQRSPPQDTEHKKDREDSSPKADSRILWASRKTAVPELQAWLTQEEQAPVNPWVESLLQQDITPLFEWCTPRQDVGVLHYEQPSLTLLALRHNVTGEYLPLPAPLDSSIPVPMVQVQTAESWSELQTLQATAQDVEGVVVQFPNGGDWYKLKTTWYLQMVHASKVGGPHNFIGQWLDREPDLRRVPTKRLWQLAVTPPSQQDDVMAHVLSQLSMSDRPEQGQHLLQFVTRVQQQIPVLMDHLMDWAVDVVSNSDVDTLSDKAQQVGWPTWLVSDLLAAHHQQSKDANDRDSAPHVTIVLEKLTNFLGHLARAASVPVTTLEDLLQVRWDRDTAECREWISIEMTLPECDDCPTEIQDHLVETYLPAKLCQMLGISNKKPDPSETTIQIPRRYPPDEGKIKGLWEKFSEKYNIWDLRIDLQPCRHLGYTEHEGSPDYALLLVQHGLKGDKKGLPSGTFGGVLVPTNYNASFDQLQQGLKLSLEQRRLVRLPRLARHRPLAITNNKDNVQKEKFHFYCDLDGVLADFERGLRELPSYREGDAPQKMWSKVLRAPGFFQHLEWMPGAEDMWTELIELNQGIKPSILSGIPVQAKKQVTREKKNWCKVHLGDDVEVICDQTSKKHTYSGENQVLIDDRFETISTWRSYPGAIGIHHVSVERTLYEIRRLLGQLPLVSFHEPPLELPLYQMSQTNELVTDQLPESLQNESRVAIDVEWDPKQASGISMVQLATSSHVYLLDMEQGTPLLQESLQELLQNGDITKIGFALSGDLNRLGTSMISAVDLQQVAIDQVDVFSQQHSLPSLGRVAARVLQKQLAKTKEYQANDWSVRPLSSELIEYAAMDAAVLLELAKALPTTPSLNLYPSKSSKKIAQTAAHSPQNQAQTFDLDPSLPCQILFLGLFLTPESQTQLQTKFPCRLPLQHGDHVTLAHRPSERDLRGADVGTTLEFTIIGTYLDARVQVLQVQFQGTTNYHLTVSTAHGVPPKDAGNIPHEAFQALDEPLVLRGILGVRVVAEQDPLAPLPLRIKDKIQELQAQDPGSKLKFKPGELSASERALIHDYAEHHGLESASSGKDNKRRLILTKLRQQAMAGSEIQTVSHKVTDPFLFALLNVSSPNSLLPTIGQLTLNGSIDWLESPPSFLSQGREEPVLILLRGLPGSGKSHLANWLAEEYSGNVASADHYFVDKKDGAYKFQASDLPQAHASCQEKVRQWMSLGTPCIIVDNTHSRLSEYQAYLDFANDYGYTNVWILEIHCRDKAQAHEFAHRNQHGVPPGQVLKMLSRWQSDDRAQLLSPYNPTSSNDSNKNPTSMAPVGGNDFHHWLSDHKLCHFNKQRGGQYMSMAVGSRPCLFVDVPPHLETEFLERYAGSGVDETSEPKYLLQLMAPTVRMFFDIDHCCVNHDMAMSQKDIEQLAQQASELLSHSRVIVLGCQEEERASGRIKSGLHLYSDNVCDASECLRLRQEYVTRLQRWNPTVDWSTIVDDQVYRVGCGLRLLGSRKVTKQVDRGRLYRLYGVWENGAWTCPSWSPLEILRATQLRA